MRHRLFTTIMNMSEDQLNAYAKERHLTLPEEFCCSKPTQSKAEYICNALGFEDPDADDDDADEVDPFGSQLDNIVTQLMKEHPTWDYMRALGEARKRYPELAARWAKSFPGGVSAGRRKRV